VLLLGTLRNDISSISISISISISSKNQVGYYKIMCSNFIPQVHDSDIHGDAGNLT
jgi:hypothetical protein